jgi:mannose-6-phosphate isomerase-like protein (cupin superfamily)
MPVIHTSGVGTETIVGAEHEATISLILDRSEPSKGPRLHRHAYDETWVVIEGNVDFQAGDEHHHATAGDVVVVPARVPHKFTNEGPGPTHLVCIHSSPTIVGEWLE